MVINAVKHAMLVGNIILQLLFHDDCILLLLFTCHLQSKLNLFLNTTNIRLLNNTIRFPVCDLYSDRMKENNLLEDRFP